jgi:hypothetical protein
VSHDRKQERTRHVRPASDDQIAGCPLPFCNHRYHYFVGAKRVLLVNTSWDEAELRGELSGGTRNSGCWDFIRLYLSDVAATRAPVDILALHKHISV